MIKVLDSWIADKIAAGEVIERPLSIVKELVENSIDAGAQAVIIELKNGGKSYIRVTDNGCGIADDEIETAFLRHATSKINSVSDLNAISTLGFRGEALASIAAVTRLTIVSKPEGQTAGTRLVINGGQIVSRTSVGANKGTTIVVEDVFYNTPARRKFMKTDGAEAAAVIEYVNSMAVYYADIRFMLINNGKTVINTSGDGDVRNTITDIFKSSDFSDLYEINADNIRAFISDPGTTRPNKKGQLFYVNGRLVGSKTIEEGIIKGYGDRVFSGHPIAVIFLDIDPSEIDVNIHPGKREIKFVKDSEVVELVSSSIRDAMSKEASVPSASCEYIKAPDCNAEEPLRDEQLDVKSFLSGLDNDVPAPVSYKAPPSEQRAQPNISLGEARAEQEYNPAYEYSNSKNNDFDWEALRLCGYLLSTYIMLEKSDAVYIIDQHAAHERIFYEKLLAQYNSAEHRAQDILTPFIIDTSADIYNYDREWMDKLRSMGYDIEDFGSNSFIIKGIPEFMTVTEANAFASAFINMLGEYNSNTNVIDKLIIKSCKSAVKAGDRLSEGEIHELINKLSECNNPFSCPHGRPTLVKLTKYEIEKIFKRR